ncbi:hypothetical protein BH10ACT3_BH10ACT3_22500 [soil metagenome]
MRSFRGLVVSRSCWHLAAASLVMAVLAGCSSDSPDSPEDTTTAPTTSTTASPVSSTTAVPVVDRSPLVIAHRGASADAPEHTFAAYDLALAQGADYIEQDLQLTADGVLVVLHDPVLDRVARGPAASCSGLVADQTLAQLEQCDVGSWFNEAHPERADPAYVGLRIPTMAQVLDRYGADVRYYIELKAATAGSGMEAPLLDQLGAAGLLDPVDADRRVIVQSFGPDVLRTVHDLQPDLPLVLLLPATGAPIDPSTLDGVDEYAIGVGPPIAWVDGTLVHAAHERCLEVHPYTVDDSTEMTRLLDAGVDGLFTNAPDTLRATIAGRPAIAPVCPAPS